MRGNKIHLTIFVFFVCIFNTTSQTNTDDLSVDFHRNKRQAFRKKMLKNSVALFFTNPIRNRSNDVDYLYHPDPTFYYLTGFREPNAVLLIFSDDQKDKTGVVYNELLYVPGKNPYYELWNGKIMGPEAVVSRLGIKKSKSTKDFFTDKINYQKFSKVYVRKFKDDYRNTIRKTEELYDLVGHFKKVSNYDLRHNSNTELKGKTNINTYFINKEIAKLREIKDKEELKLLKKAVRISAIGQIEVMKAMHPSMSEREIQGIHEFVYRKYGARYEGYPSIVGAGNNGCVLHYMDNSKLKVDKDLVLMDLGAEYKGYTADVTRTIPANGKFSKEQKAIYEIVLKAQNAGIKACVKGNAFRQPDTEGRKIINQGLYELGIISSINEEHRYFPHGTSHYLGLDVHDPGTYGVLQPNSVITVEPGIYIPKGSKCDKKWWGIAVRIEDDILITEDLPVNLSGEAPRTVEEIEKMMKKKSVLDEFLLPDLND